MTDKSSAPRVTEEHIDAMVDSLKYETARVPNTSSTVATARLPNGFVVCEGWCHTVSPANFDAEQGKLRAIADAQGKARAKLFEFEGYVLARELQAQDEAFMAGFKTATINRNADDNVSVAMHGKLMDLHANARVIMDLAVRDIACSMRGKLFLSEMKNCRIDRRGGKIEFIIECDA